MSGCLWMLSHSAGISSIRSRQCMSEHSQKKGHGHNVLYPDIMQEIISIFVDLPEDNFVFGKTPFLLLLHYYPTLPTLIIHLARLPFHFRYMYMRPATCVTLPVHFLCPLSVNITQKTVEGTKR